MLSFLFDRRYWFSMDARQVGTGKYLVVSLVADLNVILDWVYVLEVMAKPTEELSDVGKQIGVAIATFGTITWLLYASKGACIRPCSEELGFWLPSLLELVFNDVGMLIYTLFAESRDELTDGCTTGIAATLTIVVSIFDLMLKSAETYDAFIARREKLRQAQEAEKSARQEQEERDIKEGLY